MHTLTGNRVFLLFFTVVLIAFTTQLAKIPDGAKAYPLFLLVCSYIVSIILFIQPQKTEEKLGKDNALRIGLFAVMMGISLLLLTRIGYILSTLIFLYAGLWYLKLKKGILFFVFPLIITLSMYYLFTRGLSVILPEGSWVSLTL